MSHERILELGIGGGGNYLNNCEPNEFRVGMDLKFGRLKRARRIYPQLTVCKSNLMALDKPTIPCGQSVFDAVELRFPHNELLWWLVDNQPNLWSEFRRILKPSGSATVIFDVPPEGIRTVNLLSNGNSINVNNVSERMQSQAVSAGFSASVDPFTKQQAYDMGSVYGKCVANWIRTSNEEHKVFILRAHAHY